ncbi:hypothetical protein [Billgrantia antri]|uniref:hypothetical protein n=1 Tax=Billgrantia antri TaxID=2846777 RepID=UPI003B227C40
MTAHLFALPRYDSDALPQGQLLRLYQHELQEIGRYRKLALGFLPGRQDISLVMALFGIECEERVDTLRHLLSQMMSHAERKVFTRQRAIGTLDTFPSQVFVNEDEGVRRLLTQALLDTQASFHFYEDQLRFCCTNEIRKALHRFIEQNRVALRIKEELLA